MKKAKVKYTLGRDVDLDKEVVLDANGRRITEARARQIARETHSRGAMTRSSEPQTCQAVSPL